MNTSHNVLLQGERIRPSALPASASLDISCARGTVTVFTGPSAETTSLWLETLAALRPAIGQLRVLEDDHHDIRELRRRIGYVDVNAPLLSTLDVRMNVMLPLLYHRRTARAEAARIADRILDHVGYDGPRNEPPARLDALERMLVLLARALVLNPPLLVIDEPFEIDIAAHWRSLGECMHALARDDDRAVLVATQNLAFAVAHADQLVFVCEDNIHVYANWMEFATDMRAGQFIRQLPFSVEVSR